MRCDLLWRFISLPLVLQDCCQTMSGKHASSETDLNWKRSLGSRDWILQKDFELQSLFRFWNLFPEEASSCLSGDEFVACIVRLVLLIVGFANMNLLSLLPQRNYLIFWKKGIPWVSESVLARKNAGLVHETGASSIMDSFHSGYEATDKRLSCCNCGHVLIGERKLSNCTYSVRQVFLHTLVYGTCVINVVDLKCPMWTRWNYFDGHDAAMMSYTKYNVFHQDLLDYWLYQICASESFSV